jgi:GNAT superfamily N-acetyltransferase
MQFVDKEFARRTESAEEIPQVRYAQLYQSLHPEIGAAYEQICGGHMVFAGVGSPIGRAIALGFDGKVSTTDLDRVEEFYRSRGAAAQVDVSPLNDLSLLELLKQRGYAIWELNQVLYRKLDDMRTSDVTLADARIRPGKPEEADPFADVGVRSFFPEGNAPENIREALTALFQMQGALPFVAEVEGRCVACGAGLIIPEHRIFALFGAGTLPEFRRRGLQTAMLQTRMAAAARAGCEYAVIVTQGGTISQRNAERLGFRVAYSKATMAKMFGENGSAHDDSAVGHCA